MRSIVLSLAGILLLAAVCVGQDSQPSDDQSIAAAAKASRGQIDAEQTKRADIQRLLEMTGSGALATQSMAEMEKTVRPMVTDALPPGEYRAKLVDLFFERFRAKSDPALLMSLVIPIYDKYYSDEDIKGLIQLYETPLGKKMLISLPKVMAESQAAGTKWGEQIGRQSMMEVLTEHPELQKAMQEAKSNAAQSH
jgi:uncharacterized protein